MITRRNLFVGAGAALLAGCGAPQPGPSPFAAVANPAFDAWVAAFRPRAVAAGVAPAVADRALASAAFLPGVIERDRNQTERQRTLEDYLAIVAPESRVREGRTKLQRFGPLLSEIEARTGVPPRVVCAIWGIESNFGARRGDIPVISALATLAFDGRRGPFFESQLIAALKILQNGDVSQANMTGSWAGAMGHTQFIPTSYQQFAVDFRGDGRRDIWSDDPTDALASAATYLSRNGWRRGLTWGGLRGSGVSGRPVTPDAGGPTFVVTANFNVIKRYNNSDLYAIGVGHLSDRIAGAGPLDFTFGPDRFGLTHADRRRLQQRLNALGFDAGEPDGVIGGQTERAIRAWQAANGAPVTGQPSPQMLAAL